MTNSDAGADGNEKPYDLEERTALFGEAIIAFAKRVPRDVVTLPLITQLVRSGTSVGANYCEADEAVTKKEFLKNIGTCSKESKETKHWLQMVAAAEPSMKETARPLWQEARSCTSSSARSTVSDLDIGIWAFFGHWALGLGHF